MGTSNGTSIQSRPLTTLTSIVPPTPGSTIVAVAPRTVNETVKPSLAVPGTTLPSWSVVSAVLKPPGANESVTSPSVQAGVPSA